MATTVSPTLTLWEKYSTLTDKVKFKILRFAGREAAASFCIACPRGDEGKSDHERDIARAAIAFEPFTYFDWVGLRKDGEDFQQRRLFWEREKGPSGHVSHNLLTPKERWNEFNRLVESGVYDGTGARKIAVASWMGVEDLKWIATNLPDLKALDLSQTPNRLLAESKEASKSPWYRQVFHNSETDTVSSASDDLDSIWRMFHKLEWLEIPDPRDLVDEYASYFPTDLFPRLATKCSALKTLSIRGRYRAYISSPHPHSAHNHVCVFMDNIIDHIPESVTSLELRLSIDFIGHLLETLREEKSHIKRIGIDFGAWVQIYPYRDGGPEGETEKTAIENIAQASALHFRHALYEQAHKESLPANSKWFLPEVCRKDMDSTPRSQAYAGRYGYYCNRCGSWVMDPKSKTKPPTVKHGNATNSESDFDPEGHKRGSDVGFDAANSFSIEQETPRKLDPLVEATAKCRFSAERHGSTFAILEASQADTLPKMLKKLYAAQKDNKDLRLFALEPEEHSRSTDPIHPLALIQTESTCFCKDDTSASDDVEGFRPEDVTEVYPWLAQTFKWRPVFDWDWFMVTEKMVDDADPALVSDELKAIWLNPENPERSGLKSTLLTIQSCFQHLKNSGIRIHLVIGRRHYCQSSCYWGFPYNQTEWDQWVRNEFSTNLEDISPLVDTLSVLYDLRNPLDRDLLENIEGCIPQASPPVSCQRRYPSQSRRKSNNTKVKKEKVPEGFESLAYRFPGGPSTGENANYHLSDDPDCEKKPTTRAILHQLARRAAFSRESLGWQRFWEKYALSFTSLTTLDIRMPRCFDENGSWRLAKLLTDKAGWQMVMHTDERQYMQSVDDLTSTKFSTHAADTYMRTEEPTWPAGRFVRRTWVCRRYTRNEEVPIPHISTLKKKFVKNGELVANAPHYFKERARWGNRIIKVIDNDEITKREERAVNNAIKRAQAATEKQRNSDLFRQLGGPPLLDPPLALLPRSVFEFPRGFHSRQLQDIAGRAWRREMRKLAEQIEEPILKADHGEVKILLEKTRQGLLRRAHQPVPYNTIFVRVKEGEWGSTNKRGAEYRPSRDEIKLIRNNTSKLLEEEEKLRARPEAPFARTAMPQVPVHGDGVDTLEQPEGSQDFIDPLTVAAISTATRNVEVAEGQQANEEDATTPTADSIVPYHDTTGELDKPQSLRTSSPRSESPSKTNKGESPSMQKKPGKKPVAQKKRPFDNSSDSEDSDKGLDKPPKRISRSKNQTAGTSASLTIGSPSAPTNGKGGRSVTNGNTATVLPVTTAPTDLDRSVTTGPASRGRRKVPGRRAKQTYFLAEPSSEESSYEPPTKLPPGRTVRGNGRLKAPTESEGSSPEPPTRRTTNRPLKKPIRENGKRKAPIDSESSSSEPRTKRTTKHPRGREPRRDGKRRATTVSESGRSEPPTKRPLGRTARGNRGKRKASSDPQSTYSPSPSAKKARGGRRIKGAPVGEVDEKGYWGQTAVKLKEECKGRGIKLTGLTKKAEFVDALQRDDAAGQREEERDGEEQEEEDD